MGTDFQPGVRVRYSRSFLKSAGIHGAEAFREGVVLYVEIPIAYVIWDDAPADNETAVHMTNIVRKDRVHLEPV